MKNDHFPDCLKIDFSPRKKRGSSSLDARKINIITTTDPNGRNIEHLVAAADNAANSLPFSINVTVVEDLDFWPSEKDIKFNNEYISIRVIRYKGSITQQRAILLAAMHSEQSDIDLIIDPDMCDSLHAIIEASDIFDGSVKIVHYIRSRRPNESATRLAFSKLYTWIFNVICGTAISDANSPMVAYKGGLLKEAMLDTTGRINPRTFNYIKFKNIKSVRLKETGIPHRSHYSYTKLALIFMVQILEAIKIKAMLKLTNPDKYA